MESVFQCAERLRLAAYNLDKMAHFLEEHHVALETFGRGKGLPCRTPTPALPLQGGGGLIELQNPIGVIPAQRAISSYDLPAVAGR
ncbi:MAG: hypothetical protein CO064_03630, partial [Anaerolineae bacterium CG_4_9_14_0_8_um_filter_58_9]